ncbi:DUF4832 domain-containing protein [Mariniphaga sediminis]|uniref:DUF4832 domain-containing protein n=1 Tax=Mariniphaga sediminis TaxID=1628158 RepID=UPI0035639EF5
MNKKNIKMSRRKAIQIVGSSAMAAALPFRGSSHEELLHGHHITDKPVNIARSGKDIIFRPDDTGEALTNPGMGWVFHYYSGRTGNYGYHLEPSDSLDWFPGCSVVYMRIPWTFVEPEEGFYNWTVFDTPAQRFIAKGKKLAIRINPCEHWITWATPRWVKSAGAKGVFFNHREGPSEKGNLWDPDYLDPGFIEKFELLVKALADRYDGNPNIAWIELGIGLWGEGWKIHSSPSREINDKIVRLQIDIYLKYFKNTLICINDDMIGSRPSNRNLLLTEYALSKGLALRDDSIMVNKYPHAWHSDDLAMKFWPKKPVILETGHYGLLKEKGTWEKSKLLEAVEAYHSSYLSIHWWPQEFYRENKEFIERINQRLGYRIQLKNIKYPEAIEIGERFKVEWTWANAGVAPCYQGGHPALTVKDKKGGIVSLMVDDQIDLRLLETGKEDDIPNSNYRSTFNIGFPNPKDFFNEFTLKMEQRPGSDFYAAPIVPATKPGDYELFVSVGQKDGTPAIALPLFGDDGQHRYKIGKIRVKEPSVPGVELGNRWIDR